MELTSALIVKLRKKFVNKILLYRNMAYHGLTVDPDKPLPHLPRRFAHRYHIILEISHFGFIRNY